MILTAHLGNADMIQPGLIPLQPNLDFMDTFEPFQGKDGAGREHGHLDLPLPRIKHTGVSFSQRELLE